MGSLFSIRRASVVAWALGAPVLFIVAAQGGCSGGEADNNPDSGQPGMTLRDGTVVAMDAHATGDASMASEGDALGQGTTGNEASGDDGGPAMLGDTPDASTLVGSDGGTVTLGSGSSSATLAVPPGALPAQQTISITQTGLPCPPGFTCYSPVFQFGPDGTSFTQPVTVSLPYQGNQQLATLFWSYPNATGYQRVGGLPTADSVAGQVTHFSTGFIADGVNFSQPADPSCVQTLGIAGRYTGEATSSVCVSNCMATVTAPDAGTAAQLAACELQCPDAAAPDAGVGCISNCGDAGCELGCPLNGEITAMLASPSDGGGPDAATSLGAGVAMFFNVQDCQGRAVTNLDAGAFTVLENGNALSVEAQTTILPTGGVTAFVDLLLDVSSHTDALRGQMFAGAANFVTQLQVTDALPVAIGIETFAGEKNINQQLAPTLDTPTILAKLQALASYTDPDVDSTNLYGAVMQSLATLDLTELAFEQRNHGGAFGVGFSVVFTDGLDTSGYFTQGEAVAAEQADFKNRVVAVALQDSTDYDLATLDALTYGGSSLINSPDPSVAETREFPYLATFVAGEISSAYLLGYCSPKRANNGTVTVQVANTNNVTSASLGFNANAFGPGCSAAAYDSACDGWQCGGLGCGACDDRVAGCSANNQCVSYCKGSGACGGASFVNPFGYTEVCNDQPVSMTCGTSCADTTSDRHNCGACGVTCAGGTCQGGACTCPGGTTLCDGTCSNLADLGNCTACGSTCLGGTCYNQSTHDWTSLAPDGGLPPPGCSCVAGIQPALCSGACTDLASDPVNCGACGTQCPAGQTCQIGTCQPVLLFTGVPVGPVVNDGTNFYWTATLGQEVGGLVVVELPVAGGQPHIVGGLPPGFGTGTAAMAVANGNVYVASGNTLASVPVAGGAPSIVYSVPANTYVAMTAVTASSTELYWSLYDTRLAPNGYTTLYEQSLSGGPPTVLDSVLSSTSASYGSSTIGSTLVVANGFVYWGGTSTKGTFIERIATTGGAPQRAEVAGGAVAIGASQMFIETATSLVTCPLTVFEPSLDAGSGCTSIDATDAAALFTGTPVAAGDTLYFTQYTSPGTKVLSYSSGTLSSVLTTGLYLDVNAVINGTLYLGGSTGTPLFVPATGTAGLDASITPISPYVGTTAELALNSSSVLTSVGTSLAGGPAVVIVALDKTDGAPTVVGSTQARYVSGLAATDTAIAYGTNVEAQGSTFEDIVTVASLVSDAGVTNVLPYYPSGIVTDGTDFYWGYGYGNLEYSPVGGGTPVMQTTPSNYALPGTLALSDGVLYFAGSAGEYGTTLWSIPAPSTGGHATAITSSPVGPLTSFGGRAIYGEGTTLSTVGPDGGGATTISSSLHQVTGAIATDGTYVYYIDDVPTNDPPGTGFFGELGDANRLFAIPIAGGAPILIGAQGNGVTSLAADTTTVYWVTSQGVFEAPAP